MKPHLDLLYLTALAMVLGGPIAAQVPPDPPRPFQAKVVGILDGDLIAVAFAKETLKIRLEGIDAPESGQAFGSKAKQALGEKVLGKEVTITWTQRDNLRRIIGDVYLGKRRISLEMVAEGNAWHFVKYNKEAVLAEAEKAARAAKAGLWAAPRPIAPWDFRAGITE